MGLTTALYETHHQMGARIVSFGGWDMPLHYGSQLEEHHAVRRDAGMFDVSHMTVIDLRGEGTGEFLRYLLANDVARLKEPGKALYSCMLNARGGVIDDLITYFVESGRYRLVVNAGTTEKDLAWIRGHAAPFAVEVSRRSDLAMIAVQGPNARNKVIPVLPDALQGPAAALKRFYGTPWDDWFVARTGYTGEDGFEVMLPESQVISLWKALARAGVHPCGLGARDTLRLEAGMNLYGLDMDEEQSPLESGLGWTVAWQPETREFIGRPALEAQRGDPRRKRFVGLVLTGRGVMRSHQKIFSGDRQLGEITSGGVAPTLQKSIALARVSPEIGQDCEVEVRGKRVPARVVKPPFVRHGEACI